MYAVDDEIVISPALIIFSKYTKKSNNSARPYVTKKIIDNSPMIIFPLNFTELLLFV